MEFHAARKKHNVGTNLLTPETITAFLGQIWSYSGQIHMTLRKQILILVHVYKDHYIKNT